MCFICSFPVSAFFPPVTIVYIIMEAYSIWQEARKSQH